MLHSLENGVEHLLKRVTVETGEEPSASGVRRRRLLHQMSVPTAIRSAVADEDLHLRLRLYLDFRHVFRHSYSFDLRWGKVGELVLHRGETPVALRESLARFLARARRD